MSRANDNLAVQREIRAAMAESLEKKVESLEVDKWMFEGDAKARGQARSQPACASCFHLEKTEVKAKWRGGSISVEQKAFTGVKIPIFGALPGLKAKEFGSLVGVYWSSVKVFAEFAGSLTCKVWTRRRK